MKRIAWRMAVILAGIMLQASGAAAEVQKYDVKSGVVQYEIIRTMGGIVLRSQAIVTFDDYGRKECKETYSDGLLQEIRFSDGQTLFLVMPRTKMAYRRGPATRGIELRVELEDLGRREDINAGYIRKLPAMIVAGKECRVFEVDKRDGLVARYAGFRRVLFYARIVSSQMTMETRAVKSEFGKPVPPEKFQVPADYLVR